MSSHLGVGKTLELLERLKSSVRDFTAREDKLNQEFRSRLNVERGRRNEAVETLTRQLADDIAKAEFDFQSAKANTALHYESRKTRIAEAHKASQKNAQAAITAIEGRRKYKLQTEMLTARRNHETGLATADATLAEFQGQLAAETTTMVALEKLAEDSFKGYRKFIQQLAAAPDTATANLTPDENQLLVDLRAVLNRAQDDLVRFRKMFLPLVFRYWAVLLVLVLLVPLAPFLRQFGPPLEVPWLTFVNAGAAAGGLLVFGFILHLIGKGQAAPAATEICLALGQARQLRDACSKKAAATHQKERERVEREFQKRTEQIDQDFGAAMEQGAQLRDTYPLEIDKKERRISLRNDQVYQATVEYYQNAYGESAAQLKQQAETRLAEVTAVGEAREAQINAEYQALWQTLESEWQTTMPPIYDAIGATIDTANRLFPAWEPQVLTQWTPPKEFSQAAQFAHLAVDVEKLAGTGSKESRLVLPGPAKFALPLLLTYPAHGSVLFESKDAGSDQMIGALNNIILRLLSTAPPGRVSFTVIDPVELGQNFAGVMHLADYEEHLINSRIWTQTNQIEQRLADLNEHMEKVIQMYLRNEYATIAEYNEQAGNIAEKYHFLVIADFPAGFSDLAAKRLMSIAASGARCGVFTLIHWDQRQPVPQDLVADDLRKNSISVSARGNDFILTGNFIPGAALQLDAPPSPEYATEFTHKVGRASKDTNRVEVPFNHVAPPDAQIWSVETTNELRVPIGRTGATKLQYLAIGKGTRQHALIAGKTGSGKSTLFHVAITNLALWCSPEQVEFYLIDFKKGVEFKCYGTQRLPHARVVAIESDREFGLSVLQRVDDELKRRGDMFRKLGAQDIAGYKRAGGTEPMPRTLLMIDEFQEYFTEEDTISQNASVLLDRIVRQGRAFGIHVILGSQTLGGAYTVARTTLGQMVIRIALQCNEADAYLIMDENNPAPRLLSRPGEGIYNDAAGAKEANSPFQAVWISDDVRDECLAKVRARADATGKIYPGPIVFEGDAPADVRENADLQEVLNAEAIKPTHAARMWLGAPNSIKGPTEAVFHRQSGNNVLFVGQRDEATLAILSIALVSLAAQHPRGAVRLVVLDANPPGSPERDYLERVIQAIPHEVIVAKNHDLGEIVNNLANEMKARAEDPQAASAPTTFLFIHGLQKFKKLRAEDEFSFGGGDGETANPGAQLTNLITEGASLGFHVIATCDTYNNVGRSLSRKALTEFEMRVLFQMSANDSASLIDNPKASTLGLHRALFYNEKEGYLELFRPYALPSQEWIEQASNDLKRLVK